MVPFQTRNVTKKFGSVGSFTSQERSGFSSGRAGTRLAASKPGPLGGTLAIGAPVPLLSLPPVGWPMCLGEMGWEFGTSRHLVL